jgi:hypothetical protein
MAFVTPTDVTVGSVLTASKYNQEVVANVVDLRDTPSFLTASSTNTETGGASADFTYSAAEITLTPGTWLIQAGCFLINTVAGDDCSCAIFNQTTSAVVANSTGVGFFCSPSQRGSGLSRVVSITVTTNTAFRVRCQRGGATTIRAQSAAGAPSAYLWAQRVQTA